MSASPVEIFAAERPRLTGLAYRMLGSWADAEDVVQDAWLRWAAQGVEDNGIDRPAAWLLSTVFGTPYEEIARTLGRSEAACRQLTSRARRKLRRDGDPVVPADEALLLQLLGALGRGDAEALVRLLDPEVVLVSDGGPDRRAARRPVIGPHRVARLLANLAKRAGDRAATVTEVNGAPALVFSVEGGTAADLVFQVDERDGRAVRIWIVTNPDKLHYLSPVPR